MMTYVLGSLMGRLVAAFVALIVAVILVLGYLSFSSARAAFAETEARMLASMTDTKIKNLKDYLRVLTDDMRFLANTIRVRGPFEARSACEEAKRKQAEIRTGGADAPGEAQVALQQKLKKVFKDADEIFTAFLEVSGTERACEDYLLIDPKDGHVFYTLKKLADQGANLNTDPLRDSDLSRLCRKIVATQAPAMTDLSMYQPAGAPAAFLGVPVFGWNKEQFYGIAVVRIKPDKISDIMRLASSAGRTAEAYLVGQDCLMRTNCRFEKDSTILKRRVDTEPVKLAFAGKTGVGIAKNFRGEPVLAAYSGVGFNQSGESGHADVGCNWAAITEIGLSESHQHLAGLQWKFISVGIFVALAAAGAVLILARTISRPITELARQVSRVGDGDLTVHIPDQKRRDEVGTLAKAFSGMVENLKDQTREMVEGVSVLSMSAQEMSATAAQLAASTSKTSSAVTQTMATAEEVRQAAELANEKAKKVADSSRQAAHVSEVGKTASEHTIRKMDLIKNQMESIGETVARLSEQGDTIERIIATVQDLAGQSNLLAVNASIEAARAREHGKGFGVVAQEIKILADQSRQATGEVRAILEDIRKWVSAVVMATEQAMQAVDAGVTQSVVSGESIQSLAQSVVASSQAASVIHASAEQQQVGLEQLVSGIGSVEQAIQQNLSAASQLEISARRLEELGRNLKGLTDRYKTEDSAD